jgi:hypothetical protein
MEAFKGAGMSFARYPDAYVQASVFIGPIQGFTHARRPAAISDHRRLLLSLE